MAVTGDVGSTDWARRNGGRLLHAEWRALRRAAWREVAAVAGSRFLLAVGAGRRTGRAALTVLEVPDTPLARAVEQVARERQSPAVLGHALRTVGFAAALAELEGLELDPELLWCACLMHDAELEHPEPGRDFALRSAELAERTALAAGAAPGRAAALGDAVVRHATPGLLPQAHPLAWSVAGGALVDLLGRRLERMDRTFVRDLTAAQPRRGVSEVVAAAWRAEARAVPDGRAALVERTGFSHAVRRGPLR